MRIGSVMSMLSASAAAQTMNIACGKVDTVVVYIDPNNEGPMI